MLDPKLQVGKSPGKWADRSHQCIYIGPSPQHAGNVPLCFNPDTGNVSPQCHVMFDKHFETVSKGPNPMCPHKLTSIMDKLVLTSSWKYNSPWTQKDDHIYTFKIDPQPWEQTPYDKILLANPRRINTSRAYTHGNPENC